MVERPGSAGVIVTAGRLVEEGSEGSAGRSAVEVVVGGNGAMGEGDAVEEDDKGEAEEEEDAGKEGSLRGSWDQSSRSLRSRAWRPSRARKAVSSGGTPALRSAPAQASWGWGDDGGGGCGGCGGRGEEKEDAKGDDDEEDAMMTCVSPGRRRAGQGGGWLLGSSLEKRRGQQPGGRRAGGPSAWQAPPSPALKR